MKFLIVGSLKYKYASFNIMEFEKTVHIYFFRTITDYFQGFEDVTSVWKAYYKELRGPTSFYSGRIGINGKKLSTSTSGLYYQNKCTGYPIFDAFDW